MICSGCNKEIDLNKGFILHEQLDRVIGVKTPPHFYVTTTKDEHLFYHPECHKKQPHVYLNSYIFGNYMYADLWDAIVTQYDNYFSVVDYTPSMSVLSSIWDVVDEYSRDQLDDFLPREGWSELHVVLTDVEDEIREIIKEDMEKNEKRIRTCGNCVNCITDWQIRVEDPKGMYGYAPEGLPKGVDALCREGGDTEMSNPDSIVIDSPEKCNAHKFADEWDSNQLVIPTIKEVESSTAHEDNMNGEIPTIYGGGGYRWVVTWESKLNYRELHQVVTILHSKTNAQADSFRFAYIKSKMTGNIQSI